MPFRTPLNVRHEIGENWLLQDALVFEGRDDFFVVRKGFRTDFASIPRPVRWLFESAGSNSESGVLHDALWRESKRKDGKTPRVDPWDADGLFRRALRQSGATTLTRSLMWIAVRTVAILSGRFGREGPHLLFKVLQVAAMAPVGLVVVAIPTMVVLPFWVFYWILEWLVANFRADRGPEANLPWPMSTTRSRPKDPPREDLLTFPRNSREGMALTGLLSPNSDLPVSETDLDDLVTQELAEAY